MALTLLLRVKVKSWTHRDQTFFFICQQISLTFDSINSGTDLKFHLLAQELFSSSNLYILFYS